MVPQSVLEVSWWSSRACQSIVHHQCKYINNVSRLTQCFGLHNIIVFEGFGNGYSLPLLCCMSIEIFMLITIPVCVCRLRTRVLKFLLSWRYSLTSRTSQHPLSSSRLRVLEHVLSSIYKQYSFIPFKFLVHFITYVQQVLPSNLLARLLNLVWIIIRLYTGF